MTPIRVVTAALALVLVLVGLWALLGPHSFYDDAATYPPYNRHFIHDIGAFALGLGACLAAGVLLPDALLAVLGGGTVFGVAHFAAHVADRDLGGSASDPYAFGGVALVFAALTLARWKGSGAHPLI